MATKPLAKEKEYGLNYKQKKKISKIHVIYTYFRVFNHSVKTTVAAGVIFPNWETDSRSGNMCFLIGKWFPSWDHQNQKIQFGHR